MAKSDPKLYEKAIEYHNKHKDIADNSGKFLAHINLGIIYNELKDDEKANINHQFALWYAVQMASIEGQQLALGNLGKIGSHSFAN